jgi:predicted RND superfamily exporter protein
MRGYVEFLYRFRKIISFLFPILVVLFSFSLRDLEFEGSYRIWFEKGSDTLKSYDEFRSEFSNDDALTIYFKDENGIFNKKALSIVKELTDKLWHLKYVERVDSLTNYQYIRADSKDRDNLLIDDFIKYPQKADADFLKRREEIALKDSNLVGSFISKDGKTTMIVARLVADVNENGDKSQEIIKNLNAILDPIRERSGYRFFVNGGPPLTKAFVDIATFDATLFTPLVIVTSVLLLYLFFRRVSGALLPISVVVMAFLIVLSTQVLLGYKLNNFTANIPLFLVAIGVADAVHIYLVWLHFKREGLDNKEAVYKSLEKNMLPVLLTSVTTSVGFATLMISKVVPVFTLGIATASGAIAAFIISVFWLPAVLLMLDGRVKERNRERFITPNPKYGEFIVKNDKLIVIITALVFLILSIGLFKVRVDSNTIRYFDKDVPIRVATEFLMDELTGPMAYEIVVDSGKEGGIKDPAFLKEVERFYEDYQKEFTDVRHLYSLLDIIKRLNRELNFKDEVPNSRELIAQYLLLYSMSIPQGMEITDKFDTPERRIRITAQVNIVDTSKDLEQIEYVSEWWSKTAYSARVEGQTSMFAKMQKDVTDTLIYSLSLALVLVSLILLLIFKRVKLLWVFIAPNILPVILVIGVMGWIGIDIDLGVAIAGAIILGVAVDDTIHFLVKFFDAQKRGKDIKASLDEVLKYAGRAMIFTTVILSLSFALFIFSDFNPNKNFGIVTASALVLALIVDLLFLPALLSLNSRKS